MLLLSPSPFSKRSGSPFFILWFEIALDPPRNTFRHRDSVQFSPVSQLLVGSRGVNISSLPSFEIGSRGRSFSRSGKRRERDLSSEQLSRFWLQEAPLLVLVKRKEVEKGKANIPLRGHHLAGQSPGGSSQTVSGGVRNRAHPRFPDLRGGNYLGGASVD